MSLFRARFLSIAAGWVAMALALPAAAQCIVDNPGGSKANSNRPAAADVPSAHFSPIARFNQELPRWLCFTMGYRARLESHSAGSLQEGNSDGYLLTRFRLGMSFRPATWVSVYTELQDATAFWKAPPLAPPYQSTWDLRRAYLDLGNVEQGKFALRVGRQDLAFGHLRLLGTAYWRNASRGYDAAMAVVNLDWIRVNAFSASQAIARSNGLSHHQPGNNIHGIYSSLKKISPDSTLDPYVFWRLAPSARNEAGGFAKLDQKTFGARWAGTASSVDYDVEAVGQTGHIGAEPIRAYAWSAVTGYNLLARLRRVRVFVKFDYASGDSKPHDGVHRTFDQLYPNVHDHRGLADQVGWQNVECLRTGGRISIRRNWIVAAAFHSFWLASAKDGFYNGSGTVVARDPLGRSGTHIGNEYDVQTSYRLDRDLEFGAGVGYLRSGEFLIRTNRAPSYTYPYVMINYNLF